MLIVPEDLQSFLIEAHFFYVPAVRGKDVITCVILLRQTF